MKIGFSVLLLKKEMQAVSLYQMVMCCGHSLFDVRTQILN